MTQRADDIATRSSWPELAVGSAFLLAGATMLGAALLWRRIPPPLAHLFFYLAGFALVSASGLLASFFIDHARRRGPLGRVTPVVRSGRKFPVPMQKARELADIAWARLRRIDWLGAWLPVAGAFLLNLIALYALSRGWRGPVPVSTALFDQLAGGLLLSAAFPLLVLERRYAVMPEQALPEARMLAHMCRVPLLGVLALALAAGLRWLDLPGAITVERAAVALAGLIAFELALRNIVYVFMPLPPLATRRSASVSTIASLIQARIPDVRSFNASVRSQFGIDLARSRSQGFIRRASAPLVLGIMLLSWLLTGVTALGLEQRMVYERFGSAVAVLHPGLHVHLPWPFGTLREVEYGKVREVTMDVAAGEGAGATQKIPTMAEIEGDAPAAANRLWDASGREVGYLVASASGGRQNFEAINIDMTVIYRVGLSDAAALMAAYRLETSEDVVKSIVQQLLAHYFAGNTLREAMGQNRDAYMRELQAELQARLDALKSGIEIMAVVVEGIHPPSKAAASYHAVQAAAIESRTKVNTAHAEAVRVMKMAALVANSTRNDALSGAAERLSRARVDSIQFAGERQAHAVGGPSFILERQLSRVARGLSDKPLIIMDHRIPAGSVPGIDMRQVRSPRSSFGDPAAD